MKEVIVAFVLQMCTAVSVMEHLCVFFTQAVLCFHSESKLMVIKILAETSLY